MTSLSASPTPSLGFVTYYTYIHINRKTDPLRITTSIAAGTSCRIYVNIYFYVQSLSIFFSASDAGLRLLATVWSCLNIYISVYVLRVCLSIMLSRLYKSHIEGFTNWKQTSYIHGSPLSPSLHHPNVSLPKQRHCLTKIQFQSVCL